MIYIVASIRFIFCCILLAILLSRVYAEPLLAQDEDMPVWQRYSVLIYIPVTSTPSLFSKPTQSKQSDTPHIIEQVMMLIAKKLSLLIKATIQHKKVIVTPIEFTFGHLMTQLSHLFPSYSDETTQRLKKQLQQSLDLIQFNHSDRHHAQKFIHLPISSPPIQLWKSLAERYPHRKANKIMIIGDSLSANQHFFSCLHTQAIKTFDPTVSTWIKKLRSLHPKMFKRQSFAAHPGATTWSLLNQKLFPKLKVYGSERMSLWSHQSKEKSWISLQDPHLIRQPLLKEIFENDARFAWVLLGTNDMNYHKGIQRFFNHYTHILELLLQHGIIPILSTIPPRFHTEDDLLLIQKMNHMIYTLSVALHLPLIDLYKYFIPLKKKLFRKDGIHFTAYKGGCYLKRKGLSFGHNRRNYISLLAFQQSTVLWNVIQEISSVQSIQSQSTSPLIYSFHNQSLKGLIKSKTATHISHQNLYDLCRPLKKNYKIIWTKQFTLTHRRLFKSIWMHNVPKSSLERFWIIMNTNEQTHCVKLSRGIHDLYLPKGTHYIVQVSPKKYSQMGPLDLYHFDFLSIYDPASR